MNTRVSWIDPSHLESLLARLDAPASEEESPECAEIDTLPEAVEDVSSFFADEETPQSRVVVEDEFPPLPPEQEAVLERSEEALEEEDEEPPLPPPAALEDAGPPLDRIRERLKLIRHKAAEAGILSHVAAPTEPSPTVIESPEARLASFARRALAALPPDALMLILDAEGSIIWNNNPKPGLVLSMLMAMKASRHASIEAITDPQPITHHELPPDHVLTVFAQASAHGELQIAIKASVPISESDIAAWRHTL